jgi:prepilin-type processing-associated H-X9-DG protein
MHIYHDANKHLPTGGETKGGIRYLMGWPARIMPHIDEGNRRAAVDAIVAKAMYVVQPWRLLASPHLGDNALYSDSIPLFRCPSSELGPLSPDALAPFPECRGNLQAALHYRAVGGRSERPEDASIPVDKRAFKKGTFSRHAWYTTDGVIYPKSQTNLGEVSDGTSKTLLLGETSSATGRVSPAPSWTGIQPWTWGYYYYGSDTEGWLMMDHKAVTYPIGYTGAYFTNEMPFTSSHGGSGAHIAYCDGSVQYFPPETSLDVLQFLATRKNAEPTNVP